MSRGFESHTLRFVVGVPEPRTPKHPERTRVSQPTKPAKRGRRTIARHGELKSPHPFGMIMKIVGIFVAVGLVSSAGVAAYAAYDITASFTEGAVDLEGQEAVPPDIGAIEGGVNLVVTGTDECAPEFAAYFGDRCTGHDAEAELNDVNLLVHISDAPRRVTVISFPRDLMAPVPSCTAEDGSETSGSDKEQINSVFMEGGLNCVVEDRVAAQRYGHPVRRQGQLRRRDQHHRCDRRCRGLHRQRRHPRLLHRHRLAGRQPHRRRHRGAAVPAHASRPRERQRPRRASATSSSTCRAWPASS